MSHIPPAAPWFGADRKPPQFYRGLRIKTDTHLHEQLQAWIAEVLPAATPRGKAMVLDLGCGEGALSQRLHDEGYGVVAVDVDAASFKAEGPQFMSADLNDGSAIDRLVGDLAGSFDLVLVVEVIEHLHDPWRLLAACRRLCRPDGHLVLTTPNIGSWWGRFWFLLTGDLWGFGAEGWTDPGHINPLSLTELKGLLNDSGFGCQWVRAAGSLPVIWAYNWKRLVVSLAMLPLRLVMRGEKDGWVLCLHATPSAKNA